MGLENLKSVFNKISKNSIDEVSSINSPVSDLLQDASSFKSLPAPTIDSVFANKSIRLRGGESLIDDEINHNFGFTSYDNVIKITPISIRQFPSPLSALNDNFPDTQIKIFGAPDETALNIRKNPLIEDDGRIVLGMNNRLGVNDFVLETLYNTNHTANTDRIQIPYGQTEINTLRSGIGSLGNLDIMGYSSAKLNSFRGFNRGDEPYIVQPIGSDRYSTLTNRDFLPLNRALDDTSRLLKFYGTGAGLAFIAQENVTNMVIGAAPSNNRAPRVLDFKVGGDLNTLGKILFPPISNPLQGNTGFLNFTNQFRDLGSQIASLRKPFQSEYSMRPTLGLPFQFLGDNPKEIAGVRSDVFTNKKTRFMGLGQGSKYKNTDFISDLDSREFVVFIPLLILVFWIGIYPESFLSEYRLPINSLIESFDSRLLGK